jgi:hypothetical protein
MIVTTKVTVELEVPVFIPSIEYSDQISILRDRAIECSATIVRTCFEKHHPYASSAKIVSLEVTQVTAQWGVK